VVNCNNKLVSRHICANTYKESSVASRWEFDQTAQKLQQKSSTLQAGMSVSYLYCIKSINFIQNAMYFRFTEHVNSAYRPVTRLTQQPSVPTFCSPLIPGCLASWSSTPTAMLICSMRRSNRVLDICRYGQVVVAVASMTGTTYQTRCTKPSSNVGILNVGTVCVLHLLLFD